MAADSKIGDQATEARRQIRLLGLSIGRIPGPIRGATGTGGNTREVREVEADLERAGVLQ